MKRTRDQVIRDIEEHPELHVHDFSDLMKCSAVFSEELSEFVLDASVFDAHSRHGNLGMNGGIRCDVTSGPCACGAYH